MVHKSGEHPRLSVVCRNGQHWRHHMLRFVIFAALAGVLATVQPAFADPLGVPDQAQAAAAVTEQPASPAPASSWSVDTTAPAANAERGKAPVGFGWG
jgi:hypothetical protein